jgi:hypothetical protein
MAAADPKVATNDKAEGGKKEALFDKGKASYDVDTRRRLIGYEDMQDQAAVVIGASKASKVLCVGCGTGNSLFSTPLLL